MVTGTFETQGGHEGGDAPPPLPQGRAAAEPLQADDDPFELAPERSDAGTGPSDEDPATAPEAPLPQPPAQDEPAPPDPTPAAEPIEGSLRVSAPSTVTLVADGAASVPVTVTNIGATTTWTGMRIQLAGDRVPPSEVEVRYRHGACDTAVSDGILIDQGPVDDATLALAPGESLTLCVTVTHLGPVDQVGDVDVPVYVTFEGTVDECTTGGMTVPLAFTVPGTAPVPPAPPADDGPVVPPASDPPVDERVSQPEESHAQE
ncbi:hypothetical protein [Microbacterium sp. GXF7504]